MRFTLSFPLAIVLFGATPSGALTPHLVKDINSIPLSQGSQPEGYVTVGRLAFFSADDALTGREQWRTDGTEAGTFEVVDACPGECSGAPRFVAQNGRSYFFLASAGGSGQDLWVTGGLPVSTFRLTEGLDFPAVTEGVWSAWVASQGVLYFAADDGIHGRELWRTDGTRAGTFLVADVRPGPDGSDPGDLTDFKGRVFFRADDGRRGAALWTSDGSARGTRLVSDPLPRSANAFGPVWLRAVDRTLFFVAPRRNRGAQLWRSDGTSRGTWPLTNVRFSPDAPFLDFTRLGNRLLFLASDVARGQELWASDGTAAGTRALTNLPRPDAFFAFKPGVFSKLFLPQEPVGNRLIFRADDGRHGVELWTTDGTPKGTFLVADVCPGACGGAASEIGVTAGRAFFTGFDDAHGYEPWMTDGTAAGTRLVADLCPGICDSAPVSWKAGLGKGFFVRLENGTLQLWRTDGTPGGTIRLTSFGPHALSTYPELRSVFLRRSFLFNAEDREHGEEPWLSNGTPQGTRLVRDINLTDLGGSEPKGLTAAAGKVYFVAYDGQRFGFWASDGTAAGTTFLVEPYPGLEASTRSRQPKIIASTEGAGRIFFVAILPAIPPQAGDAALWRSDGTPAGTVRLTPPEVKVSNLVSPVALGNKVFFTADDGIHGEELWVTDGTVAGTRMVVDLQTDDSSFLGSSPSQLTAFQGRLYFTACVTTIECELWRTDGTPGGTALVKDIDPRPSRGSSPRVLAAFGDRLYFDVNFGDPQPGIWSTDGTAAGTQPFELTPGSPVLSGFRMIADGSRLFLWASTFAPNGTPNPDQGLWITDGTAAGTKRIADVGFIGDLSELARPVIFHGEVYFGSSHGDLWKSDGTEAGTGPLLTREGKRILHPTYLTVFAGRLVFTTLRQGWLFESDGTQDGTFALLQPQPADPLRPAILELAPAGSRLLFRNWDRDTGSELWALEAEDEVPASLPASFPPLDRLADVLLHLLEHLRAGLADAGNVAAGPLDHGEEDGLQICALGREVVLEALRMGGVGDLDDDAGLLQPAQALGEDIGGDPLRRAREVAKAVLVEEEQVADHEQRPLVPEQVQGIRDRAHRARARRQIRARGTGHERRVGEGLAKRK